MAVDTKIHRHGIDRNTQGVALDDGVMELHCFLLGDVEKRNGQTLSDLSIFEAHPAPGWRIDSTVS